MLGEGQQRWVEADLAGQAVVVHHQGPGVVEQDLLRHAAERPERALQPFEPARLALVPEGAHVHAVRMAERGPTSRARAWATWMSARAPMAG
jgi:hypothetical protein